MLSRNGSNHILLAVIFFSLFISGCVNPPSPQVTPTAPIPSPTATPEAPAIIVTSYPESVDNETNLTIDWTVTGGTPGDISKTAIIWGLNESSADVSGYPEKSAVLTGTTPQQFNVTLDEIPANGTIYFRAYATIDGTDIYSNEYKTIIVPLDAGG